MSTILVIDSHRVYRSGLRGVIKARFEGVVVVDASALSSVRLDDVYDLILIDSGRLDYHTLDRLAELHESNPSMRVAVMLADKSRDDVLHYLTIGFHGAMHKLQSDEELYSAIEDLLSGRIYVPSWVVEVDEGTSGRRPQTTIEEETLKLTPRQREVLHFLAKGMSNKEVARKLQIAEGTSKIHTAALLRALGARNRTEAAFMAAKFLRATKNNENFNKPNTAERDTKDD